MRSLVVGYGSIGQRHARLLDELGASPAVVSRRAIDHRAAFSSLQDALAAHRPDLVVIATETGAHHAALTDLADLDFRGRVLVGEAVAKGMDQHVAAKIVGHAQIAEGVARQRTHPLKQRLLDQHPAAEVQVG